MNFLGSVREDSGETQTGLGDSAETDREEFEPGGTGERGLPSHARTDAVRSLTGSTTLIVVPAPTLESISIEPL